MNMRRLLNLFFIRAIVKTVEYPTWICFDCASSVTSKRPCCAAYHMNICEVCNDWGEVTQLRDYGYPSVKRQFNKGKILAQLEDAKRLYIEKKEIMIAEQIEKRIVNLKMS